MLGPPTLPTQAKSQASLPASRGPQIQGLSICSSSDLGLPGHRPQKGQGPSRLPRAGSYLQTETGRSEVAVATWLQAPSPHSHCIPSSPTPRPPWLPLSFSTQLPGLPMPGQLCLDNLQTRHGDPSPTVSGQQAPFSPSPPRTPSSVWPPRRGRSHPDPAHSGLPEAHSHTSQFPFALGKAPAPMAATMVPVPPEDGFSGALTPHGSQGVWALRGRSGHLGSSEGIFLDGGPSHYSP